jgi:hypothetical protein
MQQVFSITSVLKLSTSLALATGFANLAHSKTFASKPIEVLSDPYGYAVPTHYTILRGHTKVTYSNPIFGQFTRAEISMREKTGNRITRFTLSSDAKSYRPTLIQFQPFEKHGYPEIDSKCLDPKLPSSILSVTSLGPAVQASELIAKKREELTKAKFFNASCFDPSIEEVHRNAIMNAAADVFTTDTQFGEGKSKFLRCLEDNGFAHESGKIQALAKQAISETNVKPRISLSCTADTNAKSGEYDEEAMTITIKQRAKPNRDSYAAKVFHELLHPIRIKDGTPTDLIEECCTLGERCDELQALSKRRKLADLTSALTDRLSPNASISSGLKSTLHGGDLAASTGETPSSTECRLLGNSECKTLDILAGRHLESKLQCPIKTVAKLDSFQILLFGLDSVATKNCGDTELSTGIIPDYYKKVAQKHNARTIEELAPLLPVTSPISWDIPQTPSPQSSADTSGETPAPAPRQSRTIASIASLPEPSSSRSFGSASGRRDVSSTNRATRLVDTLEAAARKVTTTLTLEKLDARKIETSEAFRPRAKDQPAQKLIVASLVDRPLQISNIADIKDLSFPNPFADGKAEQRNQPSQTIAGLTGTANATDKSEPAESREVAKPSAAAALAAAMTGSATEKLTQSSGMAPTLPGVSSPTKFNPADREPNNTKTSDGKKPTTHDFEEMTAADLKKFVVGSYRTVAAELENQKFAKALSKNGIQIYDHENRQIGAMEPALVDGVLTHTVFIYSAENSRLIQSRTSKRNPK